MDYDYLLDYIIDGCEIAIWSQDTETTIKEHLSIDEAREFLGEHSCEILSIEPSQVSGDFMIILNVEGLDI